MSKYIRKLIRKRGNGDIVEENGISQRQNTYAELISKKEQGMSRDKFIEELYQLAYVPLSNFIKKNIEEFPNLSDEDYAFILTEVIVARCNITYNSQKPATLFYEWVARATRRLKNKLTSTELSKRNKVEPSEIIYQCEADYTDYNDPLEIAIHKEEVKDVLNYLEMLPHIEKDVLVMIYLQEKTYSEIAQKFEISRQRAKDIEISALKRIRTELEIKENEKQILESFKVLTTKEREAMQLRIFKKYTFEKIAIAMSIKSYEARRIVAKATEKLNQLNLQNITI